MHHAYYVHCHVLAYLFTETIEIVLAERFNGGTHSSRFSSIIIITSAPPFSLLLSPTSTLGAYMVQRICICIIAQVVGIFYSLLCA